VLALGCFTAMWIPTIIWPADGLHVLPAIVLGLLAMECYLRWVDERRDRLLVVAGLAFGLALGFYSKALLIPAYCATLRILVAGTPRDLWRDRKAWLVFGAVAATYLVYVGSGDYSRNAPDAVQAGRVMRVVAAAHFSGVWPGFLGIGTPTPRLGTPALEMPLPATPALTVVGGQLVLALLLALSLYRRPSAWRAWAFLAVAFALNALYVGLGRDFIGGAAGREYRYFLDIVPILTVALGLALLRPRGAGEPRRIPVSPALVAVLGGGLLCVHLGTQLAAGRDIARAFPEDKTRQFVANYRHDLRSLQRSVPHPSLLGGSMPGAVMTGGFTPYSEKRHYLPVLGTGVRFDVPGAQQYLVTEFGHVVRARFVPVASRRWARPHCLTGLGTRIRLARRPIASDDIHLVLRYAIPRNISIYLAVRTPDGDADAITGHTPSALPRSEGEYLQALAGGHQVLGLRVDVPPGGRVCLSAVELVHPLPAGPPGRP
jgi:hypothetical protein